MAKDVSNTAVQKCILHKVKFPIKMSLKIFE